MCAWTGLSCKHDLVCHTRARLAWPVACAWHSLSRHNIVPRCHNIAPHCHDRACLLGSRSLAATQFLAQLSRHRTLCRNVNSLGPCPKLNHDKKILCCDLISLVQAKLCRDVKILCHDIKTPSKAKLCRNAKILCRDTKILCRDIKTPCLHQTLS